MAIALEFEDGFGVLHPAAYARIQKVIIENPANGEKNVTSEVCIYASQAAYDAGKAPLYGPQGMLVIQPAAVQPDTPVPVEGEQIKPTLPPVMECAVDPDTVTVADVYGWLHTQTSYKDAKDV